MCIDHAYLLLPGHRIVEGAVEFSDGIITAVRECAPGESAVAPAKLVMPGLVNCHGHTAMTLVRGLGGGLPLQRWLEEAIFPVEARMTADDIRAGVAWGAMEMLAGGTTSVADMYDFPAAGGEMFARFGMRARVCRVGLNFIPGRLDECLEFTRDWNADARHGDADVLADGCIHSEYLTDEPFCRAFADGLRELNRPLHVHVSETKKEHDDCLARHGKTPIAYLADTGIFDRGGYAAHCVWCTDDDFRIMAERGVTLVHNPASNLKLGSGFARITRAAELGVNVALGTDGCASNDNLDMFEEMHLAALLHKGLALDPTVTPAWQVIDMATVNGARALGLNAGEIAVGKAADFAVIDLNRPHLQPHHGLAELIVYSMHASDVVETWIAGEKVYDRGTFAAPEAADARARLDAAVKRISR